MKKIILLCIIAISLSCQHNDIKKKYYHTGELKLLEFFKIKGSDTIQYYSKAYYRNGRLLGEGPTLADGRLTGFWKEYFIDGNLRWQGNYNNGYRVYLEKGKIPDYKKLTAYLEFEGKVKTVKVGKSYKFRTYVEGLYPNCYLVTNGLYRKIEYNEDETDPYPFSIYLDKIREKEDEKNLYIYCIFPDENGQVIIGESPHIVFRIPLQK